MVHIIGAGQYGSRPTISPRFLLGEGIYMPSLQDLSCWSVLPPPKIEAFDLNRRHYIIEPNSLGGDGQQCTVVEWLP